MTSASQKAIGTRRSRFDTHASDQVASKDQPQLAAARQKQLADLHRGGSRSSPLLSLEGGSAVLRSDWAQDSSWPRPPLAASPSPSSPSALSLWFKFSLRSLRLLLHSLLLDLLMATTERRFAAGDIPGQDRLIIEWAGDSNFPFRDPVALIREAKESDTLRQDDPLVPAPAYADLGFDSAELSPAAETLLRAHGTISDRKLTRTFVATLIRDPVLTVTSGVGDSIVTHVDFKDVAAIPPANTARKILFDQVNKFLVAARADDPE